MRKVIKRLYIAEKKVAVPKFCRIGDKEITFLLDIKMLIKC